MAVHPSQTKRVYGVPVVFLTFTPPHFSRFTRHLVVGHQPLISSLAASGKTQLGLRLPKIKGINLRALSCCLVSADRWTMPSCLALCTRQYKAIQSKLPNRRTVPRGVSQLPSACGRGKSLPGPQASFDPLSQLRGTAATKFRLQGSGLFLLNVSGFRHVDIICDCGLVDKPRPAQTGPKKARLSLLFCTDLEYWLPSASARSLRLNSVAYVLRLQQKPIDTVQYPEVDLRTQKSSLDSAQPAVLSTYHRAEPWLRAGLPLGDLSMATVIGPT